MQLIVSRRLQEYMEENGLNTIVLESVLCRTWAGSHVEVSASFADEEESNQLLANGYQRIPIESGQVLLAPEGLNSKDIVRLGLSNFLWRKIITVEGLQAVR